MLLNTVVGPVEEFLQRGEYHTPINTPSKALLDLPKFELPKLSDLQIVQQLQELNKHLETIGKVLYYLVHPKQLALIIFNGIAKYSYPICLIICILALLFYVAGYKKSAKWVPGSILGYTVIQLIKILII